MRRRFSLPNKLFLALLFGMMVMLSFLAFKNMQRSSAVNAAYYGFDAGNIITDETMSAYNSMSESDIQSFLKSKNSCNDTNIAKAAAYPNLSYHIENGHFVCMADESFNGESAAHIIYQAAQDYHINPKVLIVLLEKEQGLVTDTWPNSTLQYRSATGYGCPDTAACDSQYYGFKNQVRNAAELFRYILDHGSRYYPVGNNYIKYNPDGNCGGSTVNIKNRATSALYQYTPYQPSEAVLNANPGTVVYCGAYGNSNFYRLFNMWFGNPAATYQAVQAATIETIHLQRYPYLRNAKGNVGCDESTKICYQQYSNGFIIGSDKYGYYVSMGGIRNVWEKSGFESGILGFLKSDINTTQSGISYQQYDHGFIIGSDRLGYYISMGAIRDVWEKSGFESGPLGFLKSNINTTNSGISYQQYNNGFIIGNSTLGYYISMGGIRNVWEKSGFESGQLGFMKSNINSTKNGMLYQQYDNGYIVGNDKKGYYISMGAIRDVWVKNGSESGVLGFVRSNINTTASGISYQQYDNGFIIGNSTLGYYISMGGIRNVWEKSGFESGQLGFMKSNIVTKDGISYQQFENGYISGNDQKGYTITLGGKIPS